MLRQFPDASASSAFATTGRRLSNQRAPAKNTRKINDRRKCQRNGIVADTTDIDATFKMTLSTQQSTGRTKADEKWANTSIAIDRAKVCQSTGNRPT